jgi:hypothetical protein
MVAPYLSQGSTICMIIKPTKSSGMMIPKPRAATVMARSIELIMAVALIPFKVELISASGHAFDLGCFRAPRLWDDR